MTGVLKDPLLTSARWLLKFCQFLAIVVGFAVITGAVVIMFNHDRVLTELAAHSAKVEGWEVVAGIQALLVLIAAMAAVAYLWMREMRRIVDSVGLGDPFVPENADRLQKMGWLTVLIEALSIPVGGIGAWIASVVEDATSDFGISLGGILLALVLFLLARVFREGARMRAELEGTV